MLFLIYIIFLIRKSFFQTFILTKWTLLLLVFGSAASFFIQALNYKYISIIPSSLLLVAIS